MRSSSSVAADAVDVHAGADVVEGQDGGVALVGRAGGDDVRPFDRFGRRAGDAHVDSQRGEVAGELLTGGAVDVEDADGPQVADGPDGQGLELGLGARSDQAEVAGPDGRQEPGGQPRGGGGAQGGQQGHLRFEARIPVVDVGEDPECGHGLVAARRVGGVAVDEFEAVGCAVGGRHELDDPVARMGGHARAELELWPAAEVRLQRIDHAGDGRFGAGGRDPASHVPHVDETHVFLLRSRWACFSRGSKALVATL